jgi:hypothetical protein
MSGGSTQGRASFWHQTVRILAIGVREAVVNMQTTPHRPLGRLLHGYLTRHYGAAPGVNSLQRRLNFVAIPALIAGAMLLVPIMARPNPVRESLASAFIVNAFMLFFWLFGSTNALYNWRRKHCSGWHLASHLLRILLAFYALLILLGLGFTFFGLLFAAIHRN